MRIAIHDRLKTNKQLNELIFGDKPTKKTEIANPDAVQRLAIGIGVAAGHNDGIKKQAQVILDEINEKPASGS